jgi:hypothetical protein
MVGDSVADLDGKEGVIVKDVSNEYAEIYDVKFKHGIRQCSAGLIFLKRQSVGEYLSRYKELLNLSDQTQKGNLKFVEQYILRIKKIDPEIWEHEAIWFIRQAILLHMDTFGNRKTTL